MLALGILVAGGALSRLLGDLAADLITVETADYPDGLRPARASQATREPFTSTHPN
ncbi:hypothetical protein [Mycobacterium avium]|uniref:hypothetical protein n=1 Tax=Mycobacterium avium TaxID=1764 RepID=UPI0012DA4221